MTLTLTDSSGNTKAYSINSYMTSLNGALGALTVNLSSSAAPSVPSAGVSYKAAITDDASPANVVDSYSEVVFSSLNRSVVDNNGTIVLNQNAIAFQIKAA